MQSFQTPRIKYQVHCMYMNSLCGFTNTPNTKIQELYLDEIVKGLSSLSGNTLSKEGRSLFSPLPIQIRPGKTAKSGITWKSFSKCPLFPSDHIMYRELHLNPIPVCAQAGPFWPQQFGYYFVGEGACRKETLADRRVALGEITPCEATLSGAIGHAFPAIWSQSVKLRVSP